MRPLSARSLIRRLEDPLVKLDREAVMLLALANALRACARESAASTSKVVPVADAQAYCRDVSIIRELTAMDRALSDGLRVYKSASLRLPVTAKTARERTDDNQEQQ